MSTSDHGQWPGSGQSSSAERGRGPMRAAVAGLVGLVLIIASAVALIVDQSRGSDPSPTPSTTMSPTTAKSSSATPSPTLDTSRAPGPGTYDTVMAYLKSRSFTCTDEGRTEFKSQMCTHFTSGPFMVVYVGARNDGGLGRLSLEVYEDRLAQTSKELSSKLRSQFLPADQTQEVENTVSRATEAHKETHKVGVVSYTAGPRSSFVMWVDDWLPKDAKPNALSGSFDSMATSLKAQDYACVVKDKQQSCTKHVKDIAYEVTMRESVKGFGLSNLTLRTLSPVKGAARPAFQKEAKIVLGLLPNGQGAPILKWMDGQSAKTGGFEFVDGRLVDYYPANSSQGQEGGGIWITETCWSGARSSC